MVFARNGDRILLLPGGNFEGGTRTVRLYDERVFSSAKMGSTPCHIPHWYLAGDIQVDVFTEEGGR